METIRFVYEEGAILVREGKDRYLAVGDLHIGLERKLSDRGVHLYDQSERMARRLAEVAVRNKATTLLLLGDIKESVLYPDSIERELVVRFFEALKGFRIEVVAGNHDAHLKDIIDDLKGQSINVSNELLLENCALIHGNRWPSGEAMMKRYIITAHSHVAVSLKDERGAFYSSKAWLIANLGKEAGKYYKKFNRSAKLIVMPAFNDLITGTPVNESVKGNNLGPLIRNEVFDYAHAKVYTLRGEMLGEIKSLQDKN